MKTVQSFIALSLLAAQGLDAAPVKPQTQTDGPHKKFINAHGPKFLTAPRFIINKPDGPVILPDWKESKLPTPTRFAFSETAIARQVETVSESLTITPDATLGGTPTVVPVVATVTAIPVKFNPPPLIRPRWWGMTWIPGYRFRVIWWGRHAARVRVFALRAHVRAAKYRARRAALELARRRRRILWNFRHRRHYRRESVDLEALD